MTPYEKYTPLLNWLNDNVAKETSRSRVAFFAKSSMEWEVYAKFDSDGSYRVGIFINNPEKRLLAQLMFGHNPLFKFEEDS